VNFLLICKLFKAIYVFVYLRFDFATK